jgi:putative Mg2+ transporter-C (MgtC) family protein
MISLSTMILRLGLALVCGIAIGVEREYRLQPAGMRTMGLISLGSCLFMLLSMYGFQELMGTPHIQLDPSRVASYVVAGIGFLGGGSIFLSQAKDRVRGLTTAATVWVVAAVGLACGGGMLLLALITTALSLIVLIGLRFGEILFSPRKSVEEYILTLETHSTSNQFMKIIYTTFDELHFKIASLEIQKKNVKVLITFKKHRDIGLRQLTEALNDISEIQNFSLKNLDED